VCFFPCSGYAGYPYPAGSSYPGVAVPGHYPPQTPGAAVGTFRAASRGPWASRTPFTPSPHPGSDGEVVEGGHTAPKKEVIQQTTNRWLGADFKGFGLR